MMKASFVAIVDAQVFGADEDISGPIHELVMKNITGSYLSLIPRNNSLVYPKSDIIYAIKSQFPRVMDVKVSRDDFRHLRVMVNQKTPVAVVCVTLPNFADTELVFDPSDPCYFADETGFLFEKSPIFSGQQYHLYYAPDVAVLGSTTDFVGTYATSTAEFNALQSFYAGAKNAGIFADAILMKDGGEYELYSSSTIIYFNNTASLSDELTDLLAFWNHMEAEARGQKKPVVFDYIDLRYGTNVFYKTIK